MQNIELKHPRLLSFDGFLLVLFLVIGTIGAALMFAPPEPSARPAGAGLLTIGLFSLLPRRVLQIGIDHDAIVVRLMTGLRRVPFETLGEAAVVDGFMGLRLLGTGLPAYHTGHFRLAGQRVRAYTSTVGGPFVLIERPGKTPLALSPADPDEFIEALEAARRADA